MAKCLHHHGVNAIGELALGHLLDTPYLDKLGQKSSNELTYKKIHPGEFHQHILIVYEKGCETFVSQKEPRYLAEIFNLIVCIRRRLTPSRMCSR